MEALQNLWSSITGNMKVRVNDPFIGTFLCSWVICNWNYLGLLFWGDGSTAERISGFYAYLHGTNFWDWNSLFAIPFTLSLFYFFLFPWSSFCIKIIQRKVNDKLYQQTIDVDLDKIKQSEELNKARLKANPNKPFLEQLTKFDIDRKNEVLDQVRLRTERMAQRLQDAKDSQEEQSLKTQDAKNKAKISRLERERKIQQAKIDKAKFEADSAKARATLASHRFPAVYSIMSMIEDSLRQDDIRISLSSSSNIVAALFGYEGFESLLDDKNFNNETLDSIDYVYYDDELAKRLEQIVLDENSDNEDFSAEMIFGHLEMLFEGEPFELVTADRLAEYSKEQIENNPYDIFNDDGTSGAIAESDTIFDYIEDITIEHSDFDDELSNNCFIVELSANASGEHRKEQGVPGRAMTVLLKMKSNVLLGKYGLSSIEVSDIKGSLDSYY